MAISHSQSSKSIAPDESQDRAAEANLAIRYRTSIQEGSRKRPQNDRFTEYSPDLIHGPTISQNQNPPKAQRSCECRTGPVLQHTNPKTSQ
ncbi:MAG TPA: hypothetical protein DCM28_18090 [Phycisphaerales bacterium]|nr:hypothetical protein [Phycisphaerales bacterium]